jgi:WD40 repeat protein
MSGIRVSLGYLIMSRASNPHHHVFLSHSSLDKPSVERLGQKLEAVGIRTWLDKWNLVPGNRWQEDIEEALANCSACAVFIGVGVIGPWQNEEMRAAIDRHAREGGGRFRVIPVLLPGARRPERSRLPGFLWSRTWVEFGDSLDDAEAFERLVWGIVGEKAEHAGEPIPEGLCPYRGLESFDESNARFFFGREALTDWLLNALRPDPSANEANRFLAIIGGSGSGKSSLARAGLIPAIRHGRLEGSSGWPIVTLRPGSDPLESVAVALTAVGEESTPGAIQRQVASLLECERTLHQATRLALRDAPSSRRIVVLVDQFEEAFTLCAAEPARKAFVDNLLYAGSISGGQTVVVLTMRADFYERCADYPALAAAVSDRQLLVGPMTEDELRRAIEEPARLVGCGLEPELVDVLIEDVAGRLGALPLLQYALLELWNRRHGQLLTYDQYHAIGRVKGAVAEAAESLFNRLGPGEQDQFRDLFIRLTRVDTDASPGEDRRDSRRRVRLDDLTRTTGSSQETIRLVSRLTDARLLVVTTHPQTGARQVEVAHEALIRNWPRLGAWVDHDRAMLRLREEVGDAAREWSDHQENEAYLVHRGDRLRNVEQLLARSDSLLREEERRYLRECVALRERERASARRARMVKRLTLTAIPGIVIAALAAGLWGAWEFAEEQATHIDRMNRTLYAMRLNKVADVARSDPALGLTMLDNHDLFPMEMREFTWSNLRRFCQPHRATLERHSEDVVSLSFSPDGRTLASASSDGSVALWDWVAGTRGATPAEDQPGPRCVQYSRDGKRLAWCGGDKTIHLWDTGQGVELAPLAGPDSEVTCLAFAPFGQALASGGRDGVVTLWDLARSKPSASIPAHAEKVNALAFSPDGKTLASAGDDNRARLWDAATARNLATLDGHTASVWSVAFSPDGQTLASAGGDRMILLWQMPERLRRATLLSEGSDVFAVAFSPDSRTLAAGNVDGTLTLWDTVSAQKRVTFRGHADSVRALAFSPDGQTLASGSGDNTIRLWDPVRAPERASFGDPLCPVFSVRFSPDGSLLVSAGGEFLSFTGPDASNPLGQLRIWDAATCRLRAKGQKHNAWIASVAFSPDGQTLATGSWSPRIQFWDPKSGAPGAGLDATTRMESSAVGLVFLDAHTMAAVNFSDIEIWDVAARKLTRTLSGHRDAVRSLAVSADGRALASGSGTGELKLWDLSRVDRAVHVDLKGHDAEVACLAFSPDGRTLASGSDDPDRTIRLWDVASARARARIEGHVAKVWSLSFSPDGRTLASGSADHTVRLWDPESGVELTTLTAHTSQVRSVAFSPDGRTLASGSADGVVKFWGESAAGPAAFGPIGSTRPPSPDH